jgi:hypothetical protein
MHDDVGPCLDRLHTGMHVYVYVCVWWYVGICVRVFVCCEQV